MIRKVFGKIKDAPYALAALVAGVTASESAHAASGLEKLYDNFKGQANAGLGILTTASFVLGAGFLVAGVMKLKQAQDTQGQQVKWGDGAWRVILGGCLAAVPFLLDVAQEGVSGDEGAEFQNQDFDNVFN